MVGPYARVVGVVAGRGHASDPTTRGEQPVALLADSGVKDLNLLARETLQSFDRIAFAWTAGVASCGKNHHDGVPIATSVAGEIRLLVELDAAQARAARRALSLEPSLRTHELAAQPTA